MAAEILGAGQIVHELRRQRGVAAGPVELAGGVHGERGGVALDHRHADAVQLDVGRVPVAGIAFAHHPLAEPPFAHPIGPVRDHVLGAGPERLVDPAALEVREQMPGDRHEGVEGEKGEDVGERILELDHEREVIHGPHAERLRRGRAAADRGPALEDVAVGGVLAAGLRIDEPPE